MQRPQASAFKKETPLPDGQPVSPDVTKLEAMMQVMTARHSAADPEIDVLNRMLDKILDIQYPERHEKKMADTIRAFGVSLPDSNEVTLLQDSSALMIFSMDFIR